MATALSNLDTLIHIFQLENKPSTNSHNTLIPLLPVQSETIYPDNPHQHFDTIIFEDHKIDPCSNNEYKKCKAIKRLLSCLKYYTDLDIKNNTINIEMFIKFMNNVYRHQILDDFHHFIKKHDSQLQEIIQYFINCDDCDINQCQFTARHYRYRSNEKEQIEIENNYKLDKYLNLNIDTMDSFHFYIFHLFQTSFRSTLNQGDDEMKVNSNDNPYFDADFSRLRQRASIAQSWTKYFDRFGSETIKFKIMTDNQYDDHNSISVDEDLSDEKIDTFLELNVIAPLAKTKIEESLIQKFCNFIREEEYDSESIDMDIQNDNGEGNISVHIQNQKCLNIIMEKCNKPHSTYNI